MGTDLIGFMVVNVNDGTAAFVSRSVWVGVTKYSSIFVFIRGRPVSRYSTLFNMLWITS